MSDNTRRQVAFIPEVTYGVTPVTPQTQLIEFTDFGLAEKFDYFSDPSINANRQTNGLMQGNVNVDGTIEVALCPDNYDEFLEAVTGGTWATNVLKVGTTVRSFAFEEGFTDLGQYRTFNGVTFDTLSVDVAPESKYVIAKFGCVGASVSAFSGTPIDATPTAVTAKQKFFHGGAVINEGGMASAIVSAISFELKNNVEGGRTLGNTVFTRMAMKNVSLTGKLTAYFDSVALYNKYKNSTDSTLYFTLVAGAETLKFEFPKIKFSAGDVVRAESGPVLVEMGFTAAYDSTALSSMVITRV